MKKDTKEKNQRIRIASEISEGRRTFASGASMLRDMESISDSSAERMLKLDGFKVPKSRRRPAAHPRREPRAHAGELGQADASRHDWFQEGIDPNTGNANYDHLYGIINDATGMVSALWMEKEETTPAERLLLLPC